MKITEFPKVTTASKDDIVLIDGTNGTRSMALSDLVRISTAMALPDQANHRMFIRGKNLGSKITTEQLAAIRNATFDDLYVGDYWYYSGVSYRIVDIQYFFCTGSPSQLQKSHVVVVPDQILGSNRIAATASTTGGFANSEMAQSTLATYLANVNTNVFNGNILLFPINVTSSIDGNGIPNNSVWTSSRMLLMNETMLYGREVLSASRLSNSVVSFYTQFALFQIAPWFIDLAGQQFWLSDVANNSQYVYVSNSGGPGKAAANSALGVRPFFLVG